MGCGIGYGYLHRIPVRTSASEAKTSFVPQQTTSSDTITKNNLIQSEPYKQPNVTVSLPAQLLEPQAVTIASSNSGNIEPNFPQSVLNSPLPAPASAKPDHTLTQVMSSPIPQSNFIPPPASSSTMPSVNPYSMSSISHTTSHTPYNWTHPPHPATLGGATTVLPNIPPRSGVDSVGMNSGVLPSPSLPTTASAVTTASKLIL